MSEQLLARAGDGAAFGELVEAYCRELQVHCYRILGSGSVQDAEDVLQETLVAAWRGLDRLQGRASLRAWLYRIATQQVPQRAARQPPRRLAGRASAGGSAARTHPPRRAALARTLPGHAPWRASRHRPGPEARYEDRESVSLAFIAALQHLPPRQRSTLVLRDVLGFRAAEAASILDCSLDAVNSSLERARATTAGHLPPDTREHAPPPGSPRERAVVARFTDAFERGDVGGIVALLTDDASLTMPPLPLEYQGRAAAGQFLEAISFRGGTRRFRLVATRANGQPAFGCYLRDPHAPIAHAHGLVVLTLAGEHISAIARFLDNSVLPRFGLPRTLHD